MILSATLNSTPRQIAHATDKIMMLEVRNHGPGDVEIEGTQSNTVLRVNAGDSAAYYASSGSTHVSAKALSEIAVITFEATAFEGA